jgi:hypothetical protein
MAFTIIIIATFAIPLITLAMILIWSRLVRKKVKRDTQEKEELITLLEKIVKTKDSIIDKLNRMI